MAVKRRFIPTRTLQTGMKIDQVIVDQTGRALIEKGAFLDDFQITELIKRGVTGIYVAEGEVDEDDMIFIPEFTQTVIEENTKPDPKKLELSQEIKKRVNEGIQYLYNNTDSPDFVRNSENVSGELMKSIMDSDAVAVDLNTLKVSDEYTFKHSVDVAAMSIIIGKNMGLSDDELKMLGTTGLLHDVGKAKIPNEVLNKPSRLTQEEFEVIKQHSVFGYRILMEKNGFADPVLRGVLQHHEKINGKGYPMGVEGNMIHKFAKIISVADIYDALVTDRPYKKAFEKRTAVEMIMAMTAELDITVMQSFLNTVILYPVGKQLVLSNGERVKVLQNIPGYPLRPKVVSIATGKIYDLSSDIHCASLVIPADDLEMI